MSGPRIFASGLGLGESPRWHDGRFWCADWLAGEIIAFHPDGSPVTKARPRGFPFSLDWTPAGRMLVVSSAEKALLECSPDGSLSVFADLSRVMEKPWNEIVIDGRGNTYVNSIGFDMMAGEPAGATGVIALVTPGGAARVVANGLAFPNGMVVTPDGQTLIVAESHGRRLTAFDIDPLGLLRNQRVWADLGEGAPDGLTLDAEGAIWYADVPNRRCQRVREGGFVLDTINLDRGCFACVLGGEDGRTLCIVAAEWTGPGSLADSQRSGQMLFARAPAPRAGWPGGTA